MQNKPLTTLTPEQQAERHCHRLHISRQQYKADALQCADDALVTQAGLMAMIKKYTLLAQSVSCTTVRLFCSNVIEDCNTLLAIHQNTINTELKTNNQQSTTND